MTQISTALRDYKTKELENYLGALIGGAGEFGNEDVNMEFFFSSPGFWGLYEPSDMFEAAMKVFSSMDSGGTDLPHPEEVFRSYQISLRRGCFDQNYHRYIISTTILTAGVVLPIVLPKRPDLGGIVCQEFMTLCTGRKFKEVPGIEGTMNETDPLHMRYLVLSPVMVSAFVHSTSISNELSVFIQSIPRLRPLSPCVELQLGYLMKRGRLDGYQTRVENSLTVLNNRNTAVDSPQYEYLLA